MVISEVKNALQDLIFDIGRGADHKSLHSQALNILLKLNDVEVPDAATSPVKKISSVAEEINKVARRVPNWAKKPSQVNARILTLFLELQEQTNSPVTRQMLKDRLQSQIDNFDTNLHGLCHIGPKNHGKVFELSGEEITIWEPVGATVRDFYQSVVQRTVGNG